MTAPWIGPPEYHELKTGPSWVAVAFAVCAAAWAFAGVAFGAFLVFLMVTA